ncbi:MAG: hypothetical protein LLF76_02280 [Planctomycetaceae bacterium]|nr:hypothetical protein [Planctomycetaceae bacterium]
MLCTVTDIKTFLGLTDEYDAILEYIAKGVTARFDRETQRTLLLTDDDVTEYYPGGSKLISVERYPILLPVTSIKETYGDYDFTNAEALVEGTEFRVIGGTANKGIIQRINSIWPSGLDAIEVTYKGGYLPAGEEPAAGSGQIALPDDLHLHAIQQASLWFKRRDDIGLSSVSAMGGSVSIFAKLELLPDVKDFLERFYKRWTI